MEQRDADAAVDFGAFIDAEPTDDADLGFDKDAAAPDAEVPDMGEPPPPAQTLRVLFIGNSYTSSNRLPAVLTAIAESAQSPVRFETQAHTVGGAHWEDHVANPDVQPLIAEGWDYVVLQDQSAQPWQASTLHAVKPALFQLHEWIRDSGATTVLFMTWARAAFDLNPAFYGEMAVAHYYERARDGVDNDIIVVPVGRAWARALERRPELLLHTGDGSHPNALGTYLAACSFYAVLAGTDPIGLSDGGLNLPDADVDYLQSVARDTGRSRTRGEPPLVGTWPLSADYVGNDRSIGFHLEVGNIEGPPGIQPTATQFGYPAEWHRAYVGIPHIDGLNVVRMTLAFRAHRTDWSEPTPTEEAFIGRHYGYRVTQSGSTLRAVVETTDQQWLGPSEVSPPAELTADLSSLSPGWHRFAVTYDGAEAGLWIDNELQATAPATGDIRYERVRHPNDSPLATPHFAVYSGISVGVAAKLDRVVVETYATDTYLSAALAEIALFDRALTAAELDARFP